MAQSRTLHLLKETLSELSSGDLSSVVGAAPPTTAHGCQTTDLPTLNSCLTGMYPTFDGCTQ